MVVWTSQQLYELTSVSKEVVHPRWAQAAADRAIWRLLEEDRLEQRLGFPLRPGRIHTLVTRHGMARPEYTMPLTVYWDQDKCRHHQVGVGTAVVSSCSASARFFLYSVGWER